MFVVCLLPVCVVCCVLCVVCCVLCVVCCVLCVVVCYYVCVVCCVLLCVVYAALKVFDDVDMDKSGAPRVAWHCIDEVRPHQCGQKSTTTTVCYRCLLSPDAR